MPNTAQEYFISFLIGMNSSYYSMSVAPSIFLGKLILQNLNGIFYQTLKSNNIKPPSHLIDIHLLPLSLLPSLYCLPIVILFGVLLIYFYNFILFHSHFHCFLSLKKRLFVVRGEICSPSKRHLPMCRNTLIITTGELVLLAARGKEPEMPAKL
jgi:hypothetical protein